MASAEERAAATVAYIDEHFPPDAAAEIHRRVIAEAEKLQQDKTPDDPAFAGKQQQAVVLNEKNVFVIENIKPEGYVGGLSTASADKQDDSQD